MAASVECKLGPNGSCIKWQTGSKQKKTSKALKAEIKEDNTFQNDFWVEAWVDAMIYTVEPTGVVQATTLFACGCVWVIVCVCQVKDQHEDRW